MIVVDIKMWPWGNEKQAYSLGRMYIWNKGTSQSKSRGNYGFCVMRKGKENVHPSDTLPKEITASGNIENWPRLSYSVWKLVKKCLEVAFTK